MNETDIRKYAELMKEFGLTGLEIAEDKCKIRLERAVSIPAKENISSVPAPEPVAQAAVQNTDYISVKSPIVGVFYAAPAENADPYVAVGDTVKKGQTLCIIEAMKLMNEIQCDFDCEIMAILVSNEQKVEYGQPLFRVKKL